MQQPGSDFVMVGASIPSMFRCYACLLLKDNQPRYAGSDVIPIAVVGCPSMASIVFYLVASAACDLSPNSGATFFNKNENKVRRHHIDTYVFTSICECNSSPDSNPLVFSGFLMLLNVDCFFLGNYYACLKKGDKILCVQVMRLMVQKSC